ncbi:MAG TPA: ribosome maturation factor RimP, partial [Candidatus Avipropionibacterium avicola]|nr:ribosome maturation factor RimP [Candidatus Avipropionibacterium avicola]
MDANRISTVLEPVLAAHDLELETIEIQPAGRRTLVRVVVDGDGPEGHGPGLDDIAEATQSVSAALDESDVTGTGPYTLEVSSRGVSRPL